MKSSRLTLVIFMIFSSINLFGQHDWDFNIGLGASLYSGNINDFDLSHTMGIECNDSVIALDFNYRVLYSTSIRKNDTEQKWEETNFEVRSNVKMDYMQYGKYSPFLACEMLTNKFKGYDLNVSGLVGFKYRIYTKPSFCDYSISAAFVYDWSKYTDETYLRDNNYSISIRPKIKQKIADNLKLVHYTFYQPSVLDFGDFIISSVTTLQTQITKTLHLDFSLDYEYRSRVPSENYNKYDLLTEVTIRVAF